VLRDAAARYADVYRAHRVTAIAYPTIPIVAPPIRAGDPKEPLGELITVNGKQIEEGKVAARNIFIAPRMGDAALSVPAGLALELPVGLEFDALPGNDTELLGLGIAVQEAIGHIPPPVLVASPRTRQKK
jgi:indoleacetamide hydrolase